MSKGSSPSSEVGGSSVIAVTCASRRPSGVVGYPAVLMESSWMVRISTSYVGGVVEVVR